MASGPFTSFAITPDYSRGFLYSWELSGGFNDPAPWKFIVMEGPSDNGPWTPISPTIENGMFWEERDGRHLVNKSDVLPGQCSPRGQGRPCKSNLFVLARPALG